MVLLSQERLFSCLAFPWKRPRARDTRAPAPREVSYLIDGR